MTVRAVIASMWATRAHILAATVAARKRKAQRKKQMANELYNENALQVDGLQVKNNTTGQTVVFATADDKADYITAQMYIASILACENAAAAVQITAVHWHTFKQSISLQGLQDALQELQSNYDDNLIGDIAEAIEQHSVA